MQRSRWQEGQGRGCPSVGGLPGAWPVGGGRPPGGGLQERRKRPPPGLPSCPGRPSNPSPFQASEASLRSLDFFLNGICPTPPPPPGAASPLTAIVPRSRRRRPRTGRPVPKAASGRPARHRRTNLENPPARVSRDISRQAATARTGPITRPGSAPCPPGPDHRGSGGGRPSGSPPRRH